MIICTNCWQEYCKCDMPDPREIDDNIIDTLRLLNGKGYKTKFSCGGHVDGRIIYIYVLFWDEHKFDTLPDGFNAKGQQVYCYLKKADQDIIDSRVEALYEWARKVV